jgi:type II secretory pathway component PulL
MCLPPPLLRTTRYGEVRVTGHGGIVAYHVWDRWASARWLLLRGASCPVALFLSPVLSTLCDGLSLQAVNLHGSVKGGS